MRFPSMFLAVVFMVCMVLATGCKVEPEAKPVEVTEPAAPVEAPSVQAEPVPVTMTQTGQPVEVAATPTP